MNGEMCKGCKYLEDEKCDVGHPCVNGSEYTPYNYNTDEELINQFTKCELQTCCLHKKGAKE